MQLQSDKIGENEELEFLSLNQGGAMFPFLPFQSHIAALYRSLNFDFCKVAALFQKQKRKRHSVV